MGLVGNYLTRKIIGKIGGNRGINFYDKYKRNMLERNLSREKAKLESMIRKENEFEKQVRRAREMHEAKKIAAPVSKKVEEKVAGSASGRSFKKKVLDEGKLIYDSIKNNSSLSKPKKKIYLSVLNFTVYSVLETDMPLSVYRKKLAERGYPEEYIKVGSDWFTRFVNL